MKHAGLSLRHSRLWLRAAPMLALSVQLGCSGSVASDANSSSPATDTDAGVPPGHDEPGDLVPSGSEGEGNTAPQPVSMSSATSPNTVSPSSSDQPSPLPDVVAWKTGLRRLSNREYDDTVRDLLGTTLTPGRRFVKETAHGFDNIASTLGMTAAQYNAYFAAAEELAEDLFSNGERRLAFDPCAEAPSADCVKDWVRSFGLKVFRRPVSEDEVATYFGVYERAQGLGLEHPAALREVVRSTLASAEFLYRTEFDVEQQEAAPSQAIPLSDFELASRLSYFFWSTMPDAELFTAASEGRLSSPDDIQAQVKRMLDAPRAKALVDSFAWQWLGMETLESHAVLSDVYPEWDEELRNAMLGEAEQYLSHFVLGEANWPELLTTDLHFVNDRLARHYGMPDVELADAFESRPGDNPERVGFLGTAGFLTVSSFAHRTSPTLRAKWLLESLWCSPPPPPPPNLMVPDLDAQEAANQAASLDNVRERLELHRSDPSCAGCHNTLDPLGLSLEHFDAIGRHRDQYDDGSPIDAAGELPDGTNLDGLPSLARFFAEDVRFTSCTTKKLFTFAMGQSPDANEVQALAGLEERWRADTMTLRNLIQLLATSPLFTRRLPTGAEP